MTLSAQFWLSLLIEVIFGVAIIAMMKQQLRDLIGWVKQIGGDVKTLQAGHVDHEGRISHVEGQLNIRRGGK